MDASPPDAAPDGAEDTAATGATAPLTSPTDDSANDSLTEGTSVGRFVLGRLLGAGSMGVVHEAFDPELGRHIALKLVSVRAQGGMPSEQARARVLREAQALAQLTHPNVVTIHDVGTHEDRIFIAMELVAGTTLYDWVKVAGRTVKEIVTAYAQAGEGLAAAHRRGLVHRDFKPHNVIVGDDGRVRVIDFGLARGGASETTSGMTPLMSGERPLDASDTSTRTTVDDREASSGESAATSKSSPGRESSLPNLTIVGSIMGTPRYMSPEQHRGQAADARSDQYAFCASLYESLAGDAPFPGKNRHQIMEAIERGQLKPPALKRPFPASIRRLCERGLSAKPERRFPNMEALLVELRRDRLSAVRRTAWIAAALVPTLALVVFARREDPFERCVKGASAATALTRPEKLEPVHAAFRSAASASYGEGVFTHLTAELEAYRRSWSSAYTETCRATHANYAQSTELFDARMACLRRSRSRVERLLVQFGKADRTLVDSSLDALANVTDLSSCSTDALTRDDRPTEKGPPVSERLEQKLDEAVALHLVGKFQESRAVLEALSAEPEVAKSPAFKARLEEELGTAFGELGSYDDSAKRLVAAVDLGGRTGEAAAEAGALIELAGVAQKQGRAAVAEVLLQTNQWRFEQRPEWKRDLMRVHLLWGKLHEEAGRMEEAERSLEMALKVAQAGLEPVDVARARARLGYLVRIRGDLERARQLTQQALDTYLSFYGSEHPDTLDAISYKAQTLHLMGRYEDAIAAYHQVLDVDRARLGEVHPNIALSLCYMAESYVGLRQYDKAGELAEQAVTVMQKALGDEHPYVASALTLAATIRAQRGRIEDARATFEQALRLLRKEEGVEGLLIYTLEQYTIFLIDRKEWEHAWTISTEHEKLLAHEHGESSSVVALARVHLSSIRLGQGNAADAVHWAEKALASIDAASSPSKHDRALARFALAQALTRRRAAQAPAEPRVLALVADAKAQLGEAGLAEERELATEIAAFEHKLAWAGPR